jgi:hypothetical protein
MYRTLRTVHLLLGLSCFTVLLMYSVSGIQMSHPDWFSNERAVTETRVSINPALLTSPRAVAQSLMKDGMWGELQNVQQNDHGFSFRIVRPGTSHEVTYSAHEVDLRVQTGAVGFLGMLTELHHVAGFYREQGVTHWWAAFVVFTSLALLLLGITGVYMWFQLHKERLVGGIILSAGLTVGLGLLIATRLQP